MTWRTGSSDPGERGSAATAAVSVIAALCIIAAVIFAFYYFMTPPPTTAGQIVSLDAFPIHNVSGGGIIASGISGQPETFNEVIVLANVKLKNTAKVPEHLFDLDSYLYAPDGTIYENGAASQKDFERAFMAYAQMVPKKGPELRRDTVLQPGQVVSGQMLFHYPITEQQWENRKELHIVVSWKNQNNLVLKLKGKATSSGWEH